MHEDHQAVFMNALRAMTAFKSAFNRDLSADVIAELYVANQLGLAFPDKRNNPGYDAISPTNQRYQIKYRAIGTQKVILNSFEFDYVILVNLDAHYQLAGMWRMDQATSLQIFTPQARTTKFRTTQARFKRESVQLVISDMEQSHYGN